MKFLMVTSPGIFEDDDDKHSDRVRKLLREKFPEVRALTSSVMAFRPQETPEKRAKRILAAARKRNLPNIVVYRDNLGTSQVIEALDEVLSRARKNPPKLIRI